MHKSSLILSLSTVLLVMALAMILPAPAAADPARQATPTPVDPVGGLLHAPDAVPDTETQVNTVVLPPRDRIDLAQRLLGVTAIPDPPTSPTYAWQVGDTATFWVDDNDNDAQFQMTATLVYMTEHAYFWVETDYPIDEAALRRSADTFSRHTYPTVREVFGSEWSPGIDGDPRVHILHTTRMGSGIAGYFSSSSEQPVEAVSTSNQHEMFYINLDTMANDFGTAYYDGVLAHEFQHMIHWHIDLNEETWMGEGLSELAALLTGFDRQGFAGQYLRAPTTQLNAWPDTDDHLQRYGAAFLFITYFYERFGMDAIRQLVADPANGFTSIDSTLEVLAITDPLTGQPMDSDDLFADWVIANLLDDPGVADGRYTYTLLDPALPTMTITERVDVFPYQRSSSTIAQYSAHTLQLSPVGQRQVQVDFTGDATVRLVPTDASSGHMMWYSNRGDASDSRLTRGFNLIGVDKAALEFDVWYDLEYLWDYAYVMASTDGGATWDILPTQHTTDANPHNTAYGPGYTGQSADISPDESGWLHEVVDLSAYSGGPVLVRFEMITDEATNQPGIAIDNVIVPELNSFEDFEKGPGSWGSEGWLLIDNVLTQRWIVQAVTQSPDGTAVTRLLDSTDGVSGSWTVDVGGPAGTVTLVISPLAPLTTEPGTYTLTVTPVE